MLVITSRFCSCFRACSRFFLIKPDAVLLAEINHDAGASGENFLAHQLAAVRARPVMARLGKGSSGIFWLKSGRSQPSRNAGSRTFQQKPHQTIRTSQDGFLQAIPNGLFQHWNRRGQWAPRQDTHGYVAHRTFT
jgi:hypothetical protein